MKKPESQLDPSKPLMDQWKLIRACDNESSPAWFELKGQRYILKHYEAPEKPETPS